MRQAWALGISFTSWNTASPPGPPLIAPSAAPACQSTPSTLTARTSWRPRRAKNELRAWRKPGAAADKPRRGDTMASKAEQHISHLLRPILAELSDGGSIPGSEQFQEVLSGLEYFL